MTSGRDVIIALDFSGAEEALKFLDRFGGVRKPFVKVGMELFDAAGADIVREIRKRGHRVFLDLKLHDIPNTVRRTMAVLSGLDVDMVNVHAAGTIEMMKAAVEGAARPDGSSPLVIAVTQLTSTDETRLRDELLIPVGMQETVTRYALNAREAGLDGVVCSPAEVPGIKEVCGGDFLTVTPGIRFADAGADDQRRVTTPAMALSLGSDYIVVGRPVTRAEDPVAAYMRCVEEFCGTAAAHEGAVAADAGMTRQEPVSTAQAVARELLRIGAVFLRPDEPFTWASGIKSPIYCDNRLILTNPPARKVVENAIADAVRRLYPQAQALMGTSTAGIAHAAIAADILGLPMGYVRGSAKDHGRANRIEGRVDKGERVVVIEDLISTAGSCIEVVEALREAGAEVLGVVSIFTYGLRKGIRRLAAAGVENHSLSNLDTLVRVAVQDGYITEQDMQTITDFRDSL